MLITSPGDGQIYYYTEGATSPAGSFQGYGRIPRAVQAVDRGFREEADGIYSARFRVPDGGEFVVAMLLDEPRIVHCFHFTAKPGAEPEAKPTAAVPELQFITEARQFQAGEEGDSFPVLIERVGYEGAKGRSRRCGGRRLASGWELEPACVGRVGRRRSL
ncbi:MAG: hypothetical protein FJ030_02740 [Chloroflexi bacterium]|nr:hypothetical protein [Chloroflexota bacterium]